MSGSVYARSEIVFINQKRYVMVYVCGCTGMGLLNAARVMFKLFETENTVHSKKKMIPKLDVNKGKCIYGR